jgi:glyoxylate/hydroxypyruvate reductase
MTIAVLLDPTFRTSEMWLRELQAVLPGEEILLGLEAESFGSEDTVAKVDVALVRGLDPGNLRAFPGLKLIHCMWAGVDKLMADSSVPVDIPLVRTVDPAMADHMAASAVAHVLDVALGHHRYRAKQVESNWKPHHAKPMSTHTVGVLGFGALGRRCAEKLGAFGLNVIGLRSHRSSAEDHQPWHTTTMINEVFSTADIVVNLLPLTDETVGILNADAFATMPAGSTVINLARGSHVVDADLIAALDSGHLSRAVLDVFRIEPLPIDHPFWNHPNITVTPHVAAETDPHTASCVIASNVRAFREGRVNDIVGLVDRTRGY